VLGDLIAGFTKLVGQQGRGVFFVVRQFGVSVNALIGLDEARDLAVHDGG
jgi:hypothetical protein